MSEHLQLQLSAEQGHLVMTALAERPFRLVYELIGKLNGQANASNASSMQQGSYACAVSAAELKLILEALGQLPYQQVHLLIEALHQQVSRQLAAGSGKAARARRDANDTRKAGKR